MKVVYVAGPYRSPGGPWGVRENIDYATRVARELWLLGLAVICPHANTAWMDGPQLAVNEHGAVCGSGDEVFLRGDLELLSRCDAIVLVGKWRESSGAKTEYLQALASAQRVFYWPTDVEALKEFARE